MTKTIITVDMTKEQRDEFVNGWIQAGGYMGDANSPVPWCAPWYYQLEIKVEGETPEEWGADWWRQTKAEFEQILKEEQANE